MMSNLLQTKQFGKLVVKIQEPEEVANAPVVVMLHGWTGDENSMWVFSSKLPQNALFIAPRGLFPSGHSFRSGFSWVEDTSVKWVDRQVFSESIEALDGLLADLADQYPADFNRFRLVGFSQGAALASLFLLDHPDRVRKLALLSGFLPGSLSPAVVDLIGVEVFIGHGIRDEIVPKEKAVEAKQFFEAAGATVRLCLTDVGHKLGADCFKAFNTVFADLET
jgi:phospholipase/carboxylesterase